MWYTHQYTGGHIDNANKCKWIPSHQKKNKVHGTKQYIVYSLSDNKINFLRYYKAKFLNKKVLVLKYIV